MQNSDARGKGYAYEALKITYDCGFRVLGLGEVRLASRDKNTAITGLMGKFGREAMAVKDVQFGDGWIWRVKKQEWFDGEHSK